MAGGVDAQSAQRQSYTAEIGGTFEVADTFTITLDGEDFTASGGSVGTGLTARTLKGKVYSTTQSLAYFCAVDNPTQWGSGVGSGRSEEHTSELQSLMRISYAVFCLKKKNSTTRSISRSNSKT